MKGILAQGPGATDEVRKLLDRVQLTLPVLLSNLVTVADVAVTYQPNLEQLLVLLPPGVEVLQGAGLANRNTKQSYKGIFLSFNLNLNLPPPCTTGYLPTRSSGRRPTWTPRIGPPATFIAGCLKILDLRCVARETCRVKRGQGSGHPRSNMCESDENYVPLNDGNNWKGDPNGTLSGQAVPQPPPGTSRRLRHVRGPAPPPIAVARVRPCQRHLYRSRRPAIRPEEPQPRRRQADLAGHADATEGKLINEAPKRHSHSRIRSRRR